MNLSSTLVAMLRRLAGGSGLLLSSLAAWHLSGARGLPQFDVLLLGLGLALLALALLGPRAPAAWSGLALMTMNTLLVLALVELAAGGALLLLPAPPPAFLLDRSNAEAAAYFADKAWAPAFWREHWPALTRHEFRPFALWQSGPSTGRYVNVGPDLLRRTPGSRCGPGSIRVFVFGGSTVWGWGSPDSGTIPARLQAALEARHANACVVNYGQLGYVTTQELIVLQQQLQTGNVPDVAIFYDGFNDCLPAQMGFGPGGHWNLDDIERRLTSVSSPNPIGQLLRASSTARLLERLRKRQAAAKPPSETWTPPVARLGADSVEALAAATASVYLANSRAVAALARGFGFDYAVFFQPWISTTRDPGRFGPLRGTVMVDGGMCLKYYDRVRAHAREAGVHDLTGVFDTTAANVYIDRVHLTPDGNDQVARLISGILASTSRVLLPHAASSTRSLP